jgi:hypothetical protein
MYAGRTRAISLAYWLNKATKPKNSIRNSFSLEKKDKNKFSRYKVDVLHMKKISLLVFLPFSLVSSDLQVVLDMA